MNINEEFLIAYKNLESTISNIAPKEDDSIMFWFESTITETSKQNKFKLCRTARNFLQHNDDKNFFCATESMVNFLNKLNEEVSKKYTTCEKVMIKVNNHNKWDINDRLTEKLSDLNKYKTVLVFDKSVLKGVYTPETYLNFELKNKVSKTTKVSKFEKCNFEFISKSENVDKISLKKENGAKVILVTDNGNKKEKILGYIL